MLELIGKYLTKEEILAHFMSAIKPAVITLLQHVMNNKINPGTFVEEMATLETQIKALETTCQEIIDTLEGKAVTIDAATGTAQ